MTNAPSRSDPPGHTVSVCGQIVGAYKQKESTEVCIKQV